MVHCVFATDLHGHIDKYQKLFRAIENEEPAAVFLGGDLFAGRSFGIGAVGWQGRDFVNDFLALAFAKLRDSMGGRYPDIFIILGNDDGRFDETALRDIGSRGIWTYAHGIWTPFRGFDIMGYSYIPPTPFHLKDWEKYDVSRYVDPGCVGPDEGADTDPFYLDHVEVSTIQQDLDRLTEGRCMDRAVLLFHSPPHDTTLDRAALDGMTYEYVPLDVHVGSIAIRRLIESRQPLLTLHGHVHESTRITGCWHDRIERTHMFNAAHEGPELSVVRFDLENLDAATRELL